MVSINLSEKEETFFFILVLPFHTFLRRLALELTRLPLLELRGPFAWGGGTLVWSRRSQHCIVAHSAGVWVADGFLSGCLNSEREREKDSSTYDDRCLLWWPLQQSSGAGGRGEKHLDKEARHFVLTAKGRSYHLLKKLPPKKMRYMSMEAASRVGYKPKTDKSR